MTWNAALTELRNVLATLYPTVEDTYVVLDEAGVDRGRIRLPGAAITNWHNVLSEAVKQDKVPAIADVACRWFPENQALRQAVQAFAQTDSSGPADPAQAVERRGAPANASAAEIALWQTQLKNLRENLFLIQERKSEYVVSAEVPLQLVREERRIQQAIAELERKLGLA